MKTSKFKKILTELKNCNLSRTRVFLATVKEYKLNRVSKYTVKYVNTDEKLEKRLRRILIDKIEFSNEVEEYTPDCPEPETDQVRVIQNAETDFFKILQQIENLNPEVDVIENIDELVKAKAYLIILRNNDGIVAIGYKTLPENWKMKKERGLIPLLFRENRFEDLELENVFSISNSIDFIYYKEILFILSKKEFEYGLNFREGMIEKAHILYQEIENMNLFVNLEVLKQKVGNNQRYLRKLATISNLGYYRNTKFLARLEELNKTKDWKIQFDKKRIVFTEEKIDAILTLLQNKRLHSEVTDEDFDVESVRALN